VPPHRNRFHAINEGFDTDQPDHEFLYDWGYLRKEDGRLLPTRAAVMLFGSLRGVRNLIPRPVLDVQFLGYATDESMPGTRWIDRFVSEENIVRSWEQLVAKYKFFMPKPFRDIDPVTLGRRDDPPGFRVFREAAVNLLIHQDYGDHSRKAVIKFFRDGIQFWNPGDVFGDDSRLWEPGEKEVRNPSIAMAMRRIAMCEQAGTGLRMMREAWQELGHPSPTCTNDRSWKAFEFFIPELDKEVDMASDLLRAMFGGAALTGEVTGEATGEVTGEVGTKLALSRHQVEILQKCRQERALRDLIAITGRSDRTKFRNQVLNPLLDAGLLEMTIPDKPRSSKQKYRLTSKGRRGLAGQSPSSA